MEKIRTSILLDRETKDLAELNDINISKLVRNEVKNKYSAVDSIENRIDKFRAEKKEIVRKKNKLAKRKNKIEDQLMELNNKLTRNKTLKRIRENKEYKNKVNERVRIIKQAQREGKDKKDVVKIHSKALIEKDNLDEFDRGELKKILSFLT